ncbi:unnamed protein product [Ceutorhynchus assimilis]|uniref:C2H2-type domain-containing protein n=1 Tax=Ceutorhynchus assimilis TaxID=467358 RepID=A0A9N9MYW9_9CUCU|nr:unnamed protein product [Ceutorhynchus assimilis]
MEDLTSVCCICIKNTETLILINKPDSNNIKYIKKLVLCVPNETWKSHHQICNPCISQLDAAYKFVQCCIESEKFRKKDSNSLKPKEELFTCDDCGKSFKQKQYLSQHITKLHVNKRQSENNKLKIEVERKEQVDVGKNIKSEDNISMKKEAEDSEHSVDEKHVKTEESDHSDSDDLEDNTNENDDSYSEKSEVGEESEEKSQLRRKGHKRVPLTCNFCDEIFVKIQDLMLHVRTNHGTEKPFACDQCGAKYMNKYSLLIHSRKHTNEKPFICATCGKSFVSSADLNHHTKIHNNDRAYSCLKCNRSFKTHSNLRTHRLQMHLDPAEWKFPCTLCSKKFPIKGNLIKHLKRHAGIKEFVCHICEKKFLNKAELMLHLNTHTNQRLFKCNICSKDYKNREGLRRHMKVVHDQGNWKAPKIEKKYLCPMCPKIFAFGNKLQRHIFTHTGEKPFECDYCQRRFIDKYGRKVHYKKDHNIEYVGDETKVF